MTVELIAALVLLVLLARLALVWRARRHVLRADREAAARFNAAARARAEELLPRRRPPWRS